MLDITLITVGKIKDENHKKIAENYLKRLKPFARLETIEIKASSFSASTKDKAKKEEADRLQEVITKRSSSAVFLLAEEGVEYDSISFAKSFEKIDGPITLVVAGALGWGKELRQKYPKISLSKLTMPHELARVVLLEQIYRAALILANKEYHY
ncbi:MAG: 23S rRNA (pseudouridine(1915)-N(3))-methyltransferase RlmH [Patescibacteria group bacterium]